MVQKSLDRKSVLSYGKEGESPDGGDGRAAAHRVLRGALPGLEVAVAVVRVAGEVHAHRDAAGLGCDSIDI